ncbi:MAG: hypothetical protein DRJ05_19240 [Bacteroidetes bacterium]|nr:MAG: hypothetical protein DRJ05_19240 [Bacteroidota bacterium]
MPELIIKYKDSKTLEILNDLAKYFDYVISFPKPEKRKEIKINGVTLIEADDSIDITGLSNLFTGKNMNAESLRNEAWQRQK